jgi:hypothetical protein
VALRIPSPARGLRLVLLGLACLTLGLPACGPDRQFTLLGYTTNPNYECKYHYLHVPIFKNRTMGAFRQDIAFDLTREVIAQIEQKTPYKVVDDVAKADTELTGTVFLVNKNVLNRNQLNEIREVQTVLAVELVWRDTRTGEILSQPAPGTRPPPLIQVAPLQPSVGQSALGQLPIVSPPVVPLSTPAAPELPPTPTRPLTPGVVDPPVGPPPLPPIGTPGATQPTGVVIVQSEGGYVPEFGQTTTTGLQQNIRRLATQIVSMMEKPW